MIEDDLRALAVYVLSCKTESASAESYQARLVVEQIATRGDSRWLECAKQPPDGPQPAWCVRFGEVFEVMALGNGAFINRDGDYWRDATHWMPRYVEPKPVPPKAAP